MFRWPKGPPSIFTQQHHYGSVASAVAVPRGRLQPGAAALHAGLHRGPEAPGRDLGGRRLGRGPPGDSKQAKRSAKSRDAKGKPASEKWSRRESIPCGGFNGSTTFCVGGEPGAGPKNGGWTF